MRHQNERARRNQRASALAVTLVLILSGLLAGGVAAQSQTTVTAAPVTTKVDQGQSVDVSLRVEGVRNLYGVQADLHFDPQRLAVQDADPTTEGVQIALSDFLKPDFVVVNEADNETGIVRVAFTQMAPNPPVEGDGNLATVTFETRGGGQATLTWGKVILADADGQQIEARLEGTKIQVGQDFPVLGVLGGGAAGILLIGVALLIGRQRTVHRQSRSPQPG